MKIITLPTDLWLTEHAVCMAISPAAVHGKIKRRALRIAAEQQLINTIKELSNKAGRVCVIESGMDCDGVKYSGITHEIDATLSAYNILHDNLLDWSDGPFFTSLASVKEASSIQYTSRDLAAEAHEDGHPHVLYG